jgi:hypothetical protein
MPAAQAAAGLGEGNHANDAPARRIMMVPSLRLICRHFVLRDLPNEL